MLTLSNKTLPGSPAPKSGQKILTAFVLQSILLAGCASSAVERSQGVSDDASRRRRDAVACTATDEPVSGWLAQSMLLGLTVGGGPAVIESGNAEKRRAFKKCMDARQAKSVL